MTVQREGSRVHLVLSGGGVRCIAFVGALMELEALGYTYASVSTCSSGTLVGALLCSGVSPRQIEEAALAADLPRLAGDVRWKPLRRLWSLRAWPYALYREPGIPRWYERVVRDAIGRSGLRLGDLDVPLSAAAVDVRADQLLVYSSETHRAMPVAELLRIATAIPLMYRPHDPGDREVVDAAVCWHTPAWLAAGQVEEAPILVLQVSPQQPPARRWVTSWVTDVVGSGIEARDTFLATQLPATTVIDIRSAVGAYDFGLSRSGIAELVDAGRQAIAEWNEIRTERSSARAGAEDDAEAQAARLFRRHAGRVATTVFISYAREDREWVERIRKALIPLIGDAAISVWDDSYIEPGADWEGAIRGAINRARVAILLVSNNFLESQYITESELAFLEQRAERSDLVTTWISLDGAQPPGHLQRWQALGDPSRGLDQLAEHEQAALLDDLARTVETLLA